MLLLFVCTIKITFLNQLSSPSKLINPLVYLICRSFYPFFREMVKLNMSEKAGRQGKFAMLIQSGKITKANNL